MPDLLNAKGVFMRYKAPQHAGFVDACTIVVQIKSYLVDAR
jgi:hypothetical protein